MDDKYMSLITEYIDGTLTDARNQEFERYVKEGFIDMKEVEALAEFTGRMEEASQPEPSEALRSNFYQMLTEESRKLEKRSSRDLFAEFIQALFSTNRGRLAFGFSVLVIGLFVGNLFSRSAYNGQMETLSSQMADMKEVMMMTMLEGESVTQRLKGVQMSNGMVSKNSEVTDALFITLNNDASTNVRLAALATLSEYAKDSAIREGLVKSITQQKSPLVQVALAELMVQLQESQAIKEFEPILNAENTPDDVKTALRQNLDKIM
ncbi:MAG: HEAT repeat domain-containing protein [Cytophagia bacterium]|nr:HEAT repeat domain-containing protein [Cytophagia bacterium]